MNEAKRWRELETENNKLKKLLADKLLEVEAMKDVLAKKVVTPTARKAAARYLADGHQISERSAYQLVGVSRIAYQYQAQGNQEGVLSARLKELATQQSAYGYLLLHALLKAEGWSLTENLYGRRPSSTH